MKNEKDFALPSVTQPKGRRKPRFLALALLTSFTLYVLFVRYLGLSPFWSQLSAAKAPSCEHGHRKHNRPLFGKAAEKLFLAVPNEESAIKASRQYAAKPHMAGSSGDLDTAVDFLRHLQTELGIASPPIDPIFPAGSWESQDAILSIPRTRRPRAWIDTYYPILNTPLDRSIQIVDKNGSVVWDADLKEYSDDTDPEAERYADAVPTFHGLSRQGDVTGHIVDGNYCTNDDYKKLVVQGAALEGSIVLCRYGGVFRGLKVKGGQEIGAAAVLIYSDPRDDGTVTVENGYKPYPHGPARNAKSVQRGSVQFLSMYPGDPTTPGYPSYENSTRTEGANIPNIPSLPISWDNAQKLLSTLDLTSPFKGGRVRVVNNVDTKVTPIWNTMAVIPGHIRSEVIVIGNHRDAWVMGATDPSSGTVSVHEIVRGLGQLLKKGWKPLRTIVIASWDGEEYGLVGSTEWGEDFSHWISEHVVAYLNLDSSVSGSRLNVGGSPILAHFLRSTAQELPHPTDKNRSLWDATKDDGQLFGNISTIDEDSIAIRALERAAADDVGIHPLGSGSDYTVFLQRIGIPSSDGGFSATIHDAVYHYHSVFDSVRWQEVYGDPGFRRHVAIAKNLGLQTIRLASSVILPFNTTHYAFALESYLDEVESIAATQSMNLRFNSLRESISSLQSASIDLDAEKAAAEQELNDLIRKWKKKHSKIRRKLWKAYCRIRKAIGHKCRCPHRQKIDGRGTLISTSDSPPSMDYRFRVGRLPAWVQEQRQEDDIAYGIVIQAGFKGPRHLFDFEISDKENDSFSFGDLRRVIRRIQAVNKKLATFERGFISESGIKDREWYKHLGVAPGKWLGYGATTLPALTEALTFEKNITLARYEAKRLEDLIDRLTESVKVKPPTKADNYELEH